VGSRTYLKRAEGLEALFSRLVALSRKAIRRADKVEYVFEVSTIINQTLSSFVIDTRAWSPVDGELNQVVEDLDEISKIGPAFEKVVDVVKRIHRRLERLAREYRSTTYGSERKR